MSSYSCENNHDFNLLHHCITCGKRDDCQHCSKPTDDECQQCGEVVCQDCSIECEGKDCNEVTGPCCEEEAMHYCYTCKHVYCNKCVHECHDENCEHVTCNDCTKTCLTCDRFFCGDVDLLLIDLGGISGNICIYCINDKIRNSNEATRRIVMHEYIKPY